jgi:hypothetical protein
MLRHMSKASLSTDAKLIHLVVSSCAAQPFNPMSLQPPNVPQTLQETSNPDGQSSKCSKITCTYHKRQELRTRS